MTLRVRVLIAAVLTVAPAFAQGDLAHAPMQLTVQATTGALGERCRRIETTDSPALTGQSIVVSLGWFMQ